MNFFVYTASVLVKKIKTVVTAAAIFHFSYSKCGRTADLSIAYWKKQIVLCPNINDNDKEWCNEFVVKMEKSMKKSCEERNLNSDFIDMEETYTTFLLKNRYSGLAWIANFVFL